MLKMETVETATKTMRRARLGSTKRDARVWQSQKGLDILCALGHWLSRQIQINVYVNEEEEIRCKWDNPISQHSTELENDKV